MMGNIGNIGDNPDIDIAGFVFNFVIKKIKKVLAETTPPSVALCRGRSKAFERGKRKKSLFWGNSRCPSVGDFYWVKMKYIRSIYIIPIQPQG